MATNPESQPQQQIPEWLLGEIENLLAERAKKELRGDSVYANNVRFEPNVWDLKLLFGSLMKRVGQNEIDWHTSVTVPWALAKLIDYYLRVNIAFHERGHGRLTVPPGMMPQINSPDEGDPNSVEIFESLSKIYKDVFG